MRHLTWTIIGAGNGKADQNSEEGWELLPSGDVLTVDIWDVKNSELFNPTTKTWSSAGSTIVTLPDSSCEEIGPAVLRPDGTVFAVEGPAALDLQHRDWNVARGQPSPVQTALRMVRRRFCPTAMS